MIKKNTKITFEHNNQIVEDTGGIPLSEGEIINMRTEKGEEKFKVSKKIVECRADGADLIANITYKLSKIANK